MSFVNASIDTAVIITPNLFLVSISSSAWHSPSSLSVTVSVILNPVSVQCKASCTIWAFVVESHEVPFLRPTRNEIGVSTPTLLKYSLPLPGDLYVDEQFELDLGNTVYALDSTTIDLCLTLFPWARFRKTKAAIKLHTLLDVKTAIPSFIEITDGKVHDVNILDELVPEPGSFYIMDRAYVDFERLYILTQFLAYFVVRAKSNLQFRRVYSHSIDRSTGLRCDQTIVLTGINSAEDYPEKLRRVRYFDQENDLNLTFLTNNFTLPPLTIAELYKCRWKVELFFKWIKQHLRIKSFYGTSVNAVKTQIWIAVSVYVLVAIIKKRLKLEHSLYTILQIFSVTVFEKLPITQVLTDHGVTNKEGLVRNQLLLFKL